ncbi:hypothetical protein PHMEG_00027743, partial [Phytophthora megakarya]
WLYRNPRPHNVIHARDTEATDEAFQERLRIYGIKSKPITYNVLSSQEGTDWRDTIYYVASTVRTSYHSVFNVSLGQLVFGQSRAKLVHVTDGPFPINSVYDHGTVTSDKDGLRSNTAACCPFYYTKLTQRHGEVQQGRTSQIADEGIIYVSSNCGILEGN